MPVVPLLKPVKEQMVKRAVMVQSNAQPAMWLWLPRKWQLCVLPRAAQVHRKEIVSLQRVKMDRPGPPLLDQGLQQVTPHVRQPVVRIDNERPTLERPQLLDQNANVVRPVNKP